MSDLDINRDRIRSEEYTYLTDSKTVLWVAKPRLEQNRGFVAFFLFGGLFLAAGLFQQNGNRVVLLIALFVAIFSGWHFIRSFVPRLNKAGEWVLYVGSGETPVELYRSSDKAEFDAKRDEIERALTSRPTE